MSTFKNNLKILITVTIIIKILGFIYKILQARIFPFEVLATISAINPIMSFSLVLSQVSIPILLTSLLSKRINQKTYYNRALISKAIRFNLISTTIIILIMLIVVYLLDKTIYSSIDIITPLMILFPSLYFSNMSAIIKSYLEVHDEFRRTITSNLLEAIIKISGLLFILSLFYKLSSKQVIILSTLFVTIGEISSFLFLLKKVKKLTILNLVNEKEPTKMLKPGLTLTTFSLVFATTHMLEPMLYYHFTNHIGIPKIDSNYIYTSIHSYCLPLFQISGFMTYIIIKLMTPKISKSTDLKNDVSTLNRIYVILLSIEGLILFLFFNCSNFILKIAYNKENISYMIKILAFQTYLTFFSPILTMSFESKLKYKNLLKNAIIACIVDLILIILLSLIKKIALYAIFISGFISDLTYYYLNLADFKHNCNRLPFKLKDIIFILFTVSITILQALLNKKISFIFLLIVYFIVSLFFLKRNKEPSSFSDNE